ncbi:MAG: MFS transporter [Geminicoccaceae bacterium]
MSALSDPAARGVRAIPRGIWALGFVSLFMDVSSELIHSLLPVFLVTALGASALSVGVIEGVAEATAALVKLVSGRLSDHIGRRKPLALVGYGLATVAKPLFPLADSVALVFTARFVDRIGKGIRVAPRDALVGDLAPPDLRGACYGLRQSLDTVGAFLGPLLAIVLMILLADDIRAVFWIAIVPALLAVVVLTLAVEEPQAQRPRPSAERALDLAPARAMGSAFWWLIAAASVLMLARFSEAFLILRAQGEGLALAWVPVVLVVMNLAYAGSAYPAGALSDRVGRRQVLLTGIVVLIVADVVLARAGDPVTVLVGVALFGLHMGLTQGLVAALVADAVPAARRGTAFGIFNMVASFAILAASVIAGGLWDAYGPPATFLAGAGLASFALIAFAATDPASRQRPDRPHDRDGT